MKRCPSCGSSNGGNDSFCSVCGCPLPSVETPSPEKNKKPGRGRRIGPFLLGAAIPLLLAAVLLLTGLLQFSFSRRVEGRGYASPEKAVQAYAEYLQKGDLDGMLSTFAVESYLQRRDLGQEILNWGFYTNLTQFPNSRLPDSNAFASDLNRESRKAAVTRMIFAQYLYLTLKDTPYASDDPASSRPILYFKADEEAEVRTLLAVLQAKQPLQLVRVGAIFSAKDLITGKGEKFDEYYEKHRSRMLAAYGAEGLQELAMALNIDGTDYYLIFQVACYNGRWYIMDFSGYAGLYLGGQYQSYGWLIPASELNS